VVTCKVIGPRVNNPDIIHRPGFALSGILLLNNWSLEGYRIEYSRRRRKSDMKLIHRHA
jgi:hypothetical protein